MAYPFRLKVEGEGDVNGSMVTLQSMNVGTPGLGEEGKALGSESVAADDKKQVGEKEEEEEEEEKKVIEANVDAADLNTAEDTKDKRPGVERFVTAQTAALIDSVGDDGEEKVGGKVERPGVERFETAREDL